MSVEANQITWRENNLKVSDLTKMGRTQKSSLESNQVSESRSNRAIHQAAVKFESVFLKELLKIMRKTVPKSGFLNGGWRTFLKLTSTLIKSMCQMISLKG